MLDKLFTVMWSRWVEEEVVLMEVVVAAAVAAVVFFDLVRDGSLQIPCRTDVQARIAHQIPWN